MVISDLFIFTVFIYSTTFICQHRQSVCLFVWYQTSSHIYSVCLFMILSVGYLTYICLEYCNVGNIKPQVFGIPVLVDILE